MSFPKVNFRYYLHTSKCGVATLDFEGKDMWPCQLDGRQDGQDVVEKGEGFYFNKLKEWHTNGSVREMYKSVETYFASFKENSQFI